MRNYIILLGFLVLIVLGSCSDKRKLRTNIENPIILVSGYGSKASVWENTGFVDYLKQQELVYGGKLIMGKGSSDKFRPEKRVNGKIDFFSLAYSDSTNSVDSLSFELSQAIKYVRRYTRAKKVMLVGYSMGGIVCRDYLVKNLKRHNVKTLVTIATPHKGSFLANIARASSGLFAEKTKRIYCDLISNQFGVAIDGEALGNLLIEEDNNYLKNLNNMPHPLDIDYVSIIGINEFAIKMNPYLNQFGIGIYDGDLVCSKESQNMNNISWFRSNTPKLLITKEIKGVHHLNILNQHNTIYPYISDFISHILIKEP